MKIVAALFSLCLISSAVLAQSDTGWIPIQSDNGEFSIEIPKIHKAFFDPRGFTHFQSGSGDGHPLKEMRMIASYVDGTMLSVETYDASKAAMKGLRELDMNGKNREYREVKRGSYTEGTVVGRTEKSTLQRVYLSSKTRIFILTVAYRGAETSSARHFLDSLKFDPGKSVAAVGTKKISELPVESLVIEQIEPPVQASVKPPVAAPKLPDADTLPLAILSKPRASYTEAARQKNVNGVMRFKVTLAEDGFIPKIVVVGNGLDGGLLRQTIFAILRIKFLPKVVHGKPQSVVMTIEYGFRIL